MPLSKIQESIMFLRSKTLGAGQGINQPNVQRRTGYDMNFVYYKHGRGHNCWILGYAKQSNFTIIFGHLSKYIILELFWRRFIFKL